MTTIGTGQQQKRKNKKKQLNSRTFGNCEITIIFYRGTISIVSIFWSIFIAARRQCEWAICGNAFMNSEVN